MYKSNKGDDKYSSNNNKKEESKGAKSPLIIDQ